LIKRSLTTSPTSRPLFCAMRSKRFCNWPSRRWADVRALPCGKTCLAPLWKSRNVASWFQSPILCGFFPVRPTCGNRTYAAASDLTTEIFTR
jgi:hypothetical protein